MNEAIKNIITRRSIRSFNGKQISKTDLEVIVECAINAPSARNTQNWKFTVVQNKAILDELIKAMGVELNRPTYNFYNANVMILVSSESDYRFAKEDCACALENIFLAAHALEIGSVWINQLNDLCGKDSVRKILSELKIPQNHNIFGSAALGYYDGKANKVEKKKDVVEWVL
ncbi:MAG: nitroreductase family protein [Oscillospiraceae bacterium]|nr:nitroreductase family protein [Oscillospiraceae bacterium]